MITHTEPDTPTARPQPLKWRDGLPVYFQDRAPAGLKTRRQLRAAGLSAAGLQPVAWIHTAHHDEGPLYDPAKARAVQAITPAQVAALEAGRRLAGTVPCARCKQTRVYRPDKYGQFCSPCEAIEHDKLLQRLADDAEKEMERARQRLARDKRQAAEWAAAVMADPAAAVLETDTTGLEDAYVVRIAVVDVATRRVLLDRTVNPGAPIEESATRIHELADTDVADAPRFAAILPEVIAAVAARRLVIYNAAFDLEILHREARRAAAVAGARQLETLTAECAMEQYAQWDGCWDDYWDSYTWRPLNGGPTADVKAQALITRIGEMAAAAEAMSPA